MNRFCVLFVLLMPLARGPLAALPPVESLFRNASNPDIKANTVTVDLKIRQLPDTPPLFYQLIFSRQGNSQASSKKNNAASDFNLVQIQYLNSSLKDQDVGRVVEKRNLFRSLRSKKNSHTVRSTFWGNMASIFLNNSSVMSSFLTKNDAHYLSNERVTNRPRVNIYLDYKRFLQQEKEKDGEKEKLSPTWPGFLESEHGASAPKIKEIIKSPFYTPSQRTSLIRKGKNFYVFMELEKTTALFTNHDFKLLEFNYAHPGQSANVKIFHYAPFGRMGHHAPKDILFSFSNQKYHLHITSTKHKTLSKKRLSRLKKRIRKSQQKNKNAPLPPSVPFLF